MGTVGQWFGLPLAASAVTFRLFGLASHSPLRFLPSRCRPCGGALRHAIVGWHRRSCTRPTAASCRCPRSTRSWTSTFWQLPRSSVAIWVSLKRSEIVRACLVHRGSARRSPLMFCASAANSHGSRAHPAPPGGPIRQNFVAIVGCVLKPTLYWKGGGPKFEGGMEHWAFHRVWNRFLGGVGGVWITLLCKGRVTGPPPLNRKE